MPGNVGSSHRVERTQGEVARTPASETAERPRGYLRRNASALYQGFRTKWNYRTSNHSAAIRSAKVVLERMPGTTQTKDGAIKALAQFRHNVQRIRVAFDKQEGTHSLVEKQARLLVDVANLDTKLKEVEALNEQQSRLSETIKPANLQALWQQMKADNNALKRDKKPYLRPAECYAKFISEVKTRCANVTQLASQKQAAELGLLALQRELIANGANEGGSPIMHQVMDHLGVRLDDLMHEQTSLLQPKIQGLAKECYTELTDKTGSIRPEFIEGAKNADYISQLADKDTSRFAIGLAFRNGQTFKLGGKHDGGNGDLTLDSDERVTVQSTSKSFSYMMALEAGRTADVLGGRTPKASLKPSAQAKGISHLNHPVDKFIASNPSRFDFNVKVNAIENIAELMNTHAQLRDERTENHDRSAATYAEINTALQELSEREDDTERSVDSKITQAHPHLLAASNPCHNYGAIVAVYHSLSPEERADIATDNREFDEVRALLPNLEADASREVASAAPDQLNEEESTRVQAYANRIAGSLIDKYKAAARRTLPGDEVQPAGKLRQSIDAIEVDLATFVSELKDADNNLNFIREAQKDGLIPSNIDPQALLHIYTARCAIGITPSVYAEVQKTMANDGTNPHTQEQVFAPDTVAKQWTVVRDTGLYNGSRDFARAVGPNVSAKSGVGGYIIADYGDMVLTTYSTPLDKYGNSAAGVAFNTLFNEKLNELRFLE